MLGLAQVGLLKRLRKERGRVKGEKVEHLDEDRGNTSK